MWKIGLAIGHKLFGQLFLHNQLVAEETLACRLRWEFTFRSDCMAGLLAFRLITLLVEHRWMHEPFLLIV